MKAWENYTLQVGHSENTQLNAVFKQMFKAWTLSNQKAIDLLEDKSKKIAKKTPSPKEKKPEKINHKVK